MRSTFFFVAYSPPPSPSFWWSVSVLFRFVFFLLFSSGAAVNPEGPAPRGMLANFTVLLTTVPPPPRPPQPLPGSEPAAAAAAVVVGREEADVRDALVDRDVTESIVCRRRYRILPDFAPGDRPYVVRERDLSERTRTARAGGGGGDLTRVMCVDVMWFCHREEGGALVRCWTFSWFWCFGHSAVRSAPVLDMLN